MCTRAHPKEGLGGRGVTNSVCGGGSLNVTPGPIWMAHEGPMQRGPIWMAHEGPTSAGVRLWWVGCYIYTQVTTKHNQYIQKLYYNTINYIQKIILLVSQNRIIPKFKYLKLLLSYSQHRIHILYCTNSCFPSSCLCTWEDTKAAGAESVTQQGPVVLFS
jgi:hypothetical protein